MSRLALSGGKKYYPEKMTELQKDKLKESNLKLWTFMFGEKKTGLLIDDVIVINEDSTEQSEQVEVTE